MFVVANRIPVAEGRGEGFVSLEILRPADADRYVVLTHWESEADFEAWTDSEEFRDAHSRDTPEGLVEGHPDLETHEVAMSAGRE